MLTSIYLLYLSDKKTNYITISEGLNSGLVHSYALCTIQVDYTCYEDHSVSVAYVIGCASEIVHGEIASRIGFFV